MHKVCGTRGVGDDSLAHHDRAVATDGGPSKRDRAVVILVTNTTGVCVRHVKDARRTAALGIFASCASGFLKGVY